MINALLELHSAFMFSKNVCLITVDVKNKRSIKNNSINMIRISQLNNHVLELAEISEQDETSFQQNNRQYSQQSSEQSFQFRLFSSCSNLNKFLLKMSMFSEALSSFSDFSELDSSTISSEKSDFEEAQFLNV